MKKRIYKIFYPGVMTGVLLLFSVSCVKLEEKPLDFVSPQTFFATKGQIESAFVSAMSRHFGYWVMYDYPAYLSYPSHDDQFEGGDLVWGNNFAWRLYYAHYRSIADVNPAILALNEDRLGKSASQETKDQLMAMAKFLRAWNYFQLVRLWGPLPLLIETTDPLSKEITRAPLKEVYALIESDLLYAAQKLAPVQSTSSPGSPSVDVAKLLLAKVYVTMATNPMNDVSYYAKARDMAKQVIDAGHYSLVHDVDKVFALGNSFGPEMMWSFHWAPGVTTVEPQIWLPAEMTGWGGLAADYTWAMAYPEQPRKHAYLLLEDWDGNSWTTWDQHTPSVKKFLYDSKENLKNYMNFENIPILRYADALLIYAEAANMAEGGPSQAACDAVNQIIDRANGYVANPADPRLTTSMSKQAFDDAVIQQRNLELCFEYDRWFDILRKRILKQVTIPLYKQNFDEKEYLLPIPDQDLLNNKKLTQNPGYNLPY